MMSFAIRFPTRPDAIAARMFSPISRNQCNADAINQNSNAKDRNTRIVKSKQEEEKQTTKNESEFISNGAQFYCSFQGTVERKEKKPS
jgi:aspartokinase